MDQWLRTWALGSSIWILFGIPVFATDSVTESPLPSPTCQFHLATLNAGIEINRIEGLVRQRVSPLSLTPPVMVLTPEVGPSTTEVYIGFGIERLVYPHLITDAHVRGQQVFDDLARKWSAAYKEALVEADKPRKTEARRITEEELRPLEKQLRQTDLGEDARRDLQARIAAVEQRLIDMSPKFDADGLALHPVVQANREVALKLWQDYQASERTRLKNPDAVITPLPPIEMQKRLVDAITQKIATQYKRTYEKEVQSYLAPVIQDYKEGRPDVRWDLADNSLNSLIAKMKLELMGMFPLQRTDLMPANSPIARAVDFEAKFPISKSRATQVNPKDGGTEFLPSVRVQLDGHLTAVYDPSLATVLIHPPNGMFQKTNITTVLLHGDATSRSNAASWQSMLAPFQEAGLNPIAIGLPISGPTPTIGMNVFGVVETSAYLQHSFVNLKARQAVSPLIVTGRSAGSTKPAAHALLYDAIYPKFSPTDPNPVDLYFLTSFSNPLTAEAQLVNIFQQHAEGVFDNIVPEALHNFRHLSEELLNLLKTVEKENPELLKEFGDNVVFPQGEADEDGSVFGGPDVVTILKEFRDRWMPLAHIYTFHDPLNDPNKYPQLFHPDGRPNHTVFNPLQREGTHFLFSGRADMTLAEWKKEVPSIPNIDASDLPALRTQKYHVIALQYSALDYLIDLSPLRSTPKGAQLAARLKEYRTALCGADSQGKALTFLQWYRLKKLKISDEVYSQGRPEGRSLVSRIKHVEQYWIEEAARVAGLLK